MKTVIDDKVYQIKFWHFPAQNSDQDQPIKKNRCVTVASLLCDGIECSYSYAICSPVDQYSREDGRRIALGRAVCKAFPREQIESRRAIWRAYFGRKSNQPQI